jgi:3-oxoacyl-[acyl-carrier-protein] synthase II
MPASHVAMYDDFRGPNNTITLREAAAHLAVGEAFQIIRRGNADAMLCGAVGSRLHSMKIVHAVQQEEVSPGEGDPAAVSRPFDRDRTGMVLGEGAAAVMLEELGHAEARGATIYGEVLAAASRASVSRPFVPHRDQAMANVLRDLLEQSGTTPRQIGHLHAHGLSTHTCDIDEARAIGQVFGPPAAAPPVTAAKSYFGNLGAGSGMAEVVASLLAMRAGRLFRLLNYQTPDAECPVAAVVGDDTPPGACFISLSVTPQGQASGLLVGRVV